MAADGHRHPSVVGAEGHGVSGGVEEVGRPQRGPRGPREPTALDEAEPGVDHRGRVDLRLWHPAGGGPSVGEQVQPVALAGGRVGLGASSTLEHVAALCS